MSYLISLFDKDTADLVALVDGNRVTGLRTAATTAVGASTLVPATTLRVGVIGSGFEARSHLRRLSPRCRVRRRSGVFSPTQPIARRSPATLTACSGAGCRGRLRRGGSGGADLILCAARSRDEIADPPGRVGGPRYRRRLHRLHHSRPARTACGPHRPRRAVVVDTYDEVVHGSGDMIAARAAGVDVDSVVVTLNAALSGEALIDREQGIRIYKSTGSGLQDIVVAEMLVHRARAAGDRNRTPRRHRHH